MGPLILSYDEPTHYKNCQLENRIRSMNNPQSFRKKLEDVKRMHLIHEQKAPRGYEKYIMTRCPHNMSHSKSAQAAPAHTKFEYLCRTYHKSVAKACEDFLVQSDPCIYSQDIFWVQAN